MFLILIACCLAFGYGCKTEHDVLAVAPQMPQSYHGSTDSSGAARISWKEYFGDPHLQALIDEGIRNNYDQRLALQKIEFFGSYVKGARGALFPSVHGNASYARRKFGLYTMDGAGNISTTITPGEIVPVHLPDHFLGLQTAWEMDIWGKLRNKKKAAFNRYLSSIEARHLIITNLVADIAAEYYSLLELDNELDIIRETIRLQQDALELVELQKQTGVTNELAVKQFRAQVLNSKSLEYETLQRITVVENRINFLLGRFPRAVPRDKSGFSRSFAFQPTPGIPAELLRNRPDIRRAEFELIASKADVGAAKAAFFPSLSITGMLGLQAFKTRFLFTSPESVAYALVANLVAPLVNRSAIKAEFTRANASKVEALMKYQESILKGYIEVYNELGNIRNLDSIAAVKSEEMNVLSESVDTANELFKTGRANYLEVLVAQKNSLTSRLEFLDVRTRRYHAYINIYKALGGGWR
jgi:NodT family efflux transporter outer membrane factor (OMF) lipoprotein